MWAKHKVEPKDLKHDKLAQAFGQQFVIENRGAGASGSIGVENVAKPPKDVFSI